MTKNCKEKAILKNLRCNNLASPIGEIGFSVRHYVEAMAMGLPVICTNHVNQRDIVKEGIFIDIMKPGALTHALQDTSPSVFAELGKRGREIATKHYDLEVLTRQYIARYQAMAALPCTLPVYSVKNKLTSNFKNLLRQTAGLAYGRAE